MCSRAETGQVSINELKEICNKDDLVLQLFDASSTHDRDRKLGAVAALKSVVKERKKEYSAFMQHQKVLKYLVRFLDPKIAGIFITHVLQNFI